MGKCNKVFLCAILNKFLTKPQLKSNFKLTFTEPKCSGHIWNYRSILFLQNDYATQYYGRSHWVVLWNLNSIIAQEKCIQSGMYQKASTIPTGAVYYTSSLLPSGNVCQVGINSTMWSLTQRSHSISLRHINFFSIGKGSNLQSCPNKVATEPNRPKQELHCNHIKKPSSHNQESKKPN